MVGKNRKSRSEEKVKTRTFAVPIRTMRRWKLTPVDATIIKLGLISTDMKLPELEKRRKSLLNRMRGDFFLILYAPGGLKRDNAEADAEAQMTLKLQDATTGRLESVGAGAESSKK